MDGELREVLSEERDESHQLAEDQWIVEEVKRVVDTEGVKNRGEEHRLTDKRDKASTFD